MNKGIFSIFILCNLALACVCLPQIKAAYDKVATHIKKYVGGQTKELESIIKDTQEINSKIEEQNRLLEKWIAAEKASTLKQKELLFHIKKKNHIID